MKQWILNLSLSSKTGVMAFCGYCFFALIMVAVTYSTLNTELTELAQKKAVLSMAAAKNAAYTYGEAFEIRNGKLYIGNKLLNNDTEYVDNVADMIDGVATVFMDDLRVATNVPTENGTRAVGTKLSAGPIYDRLFAEKERYIGVSRLFNSDYLSVYDPILNEEGEVIGSLFVGIPKAQEMQALTSLLKYIGAAGLLTALIMSIITYVAICYEVCPLKKLEKVMVEIINENTNVDVPQTLWNDEVGRISKSVESMKQTVSEKIKMRADLQKREKEAERERRMAIARMADEFETELMGAIQVVGNVAADVQTNARTMSDYAEKSFQRANTMSSSLGTVSGDVQLAAESAGQLMESIGEINRQITTSLEVASRCASEAERTSETMRALEASADSVGGVVKLIEEIAGRVNMLALNATIESARAGEAGKGFAVVANEVKNLANQVSDAAQNITQQVAGIQSQTSGAVATIQTITQTIHQMNEISNNIAAAANQQGRATEEITRNIQKAAGETSEVDRNVAELTHASAQTGEASGQLLSKANHLADESVSLRGIVKKFISGFRTGS